MTNLYRCQSCRLVQDHPDTTQATFTDFDGITHREHVPICRECGSPVRMVNELTSVLGEIGRAGAGL